MHIAVVAGNFALIENDKVIGVVCPYVEQWQFVPLVSGECKGVTACIPLPYALQEALKFKPD